MLKTYKNLLVVAWISFIDAIILLKNYRNPTRLLWNVKCIKKEKQIVPAAGVMQTKPGIMPCVAPITEGFPKKRITKKEPSEQASGRTDVCVKDGQRCVYANSIRISTVESSAPVSIRITLFGGNLSLSFTALGPPASFHFFSWSFGLSSSFILYIYIFFWTQ